jgi:hypothetical protein
MSVYVPSSPRFPGFVNIQTLLAEPNEIPQKINPGLTAGRLRPPPKSRNLLPFLEL